MMAGLTKAYNTVALPVDVTQESISTNFCTAHDEVLPKYGCKKNAICSSTKHLGALKTSFESVRALQI